MSQPSYFHIYPYVQVKVKVAAKKATHIPPKIDLTMSDLKNGNTRMTITKCARRWTDSNSHKYKELIPAICKDGLKNRLL